MERTEEALSTYLDESHTHFLESGLRESIYHFSDVIRAHNNLISVEKIHRKSLNVAADYCCIWGMGDDVLDLPVQNQRHR